MDFVFEGAAVLVVVTEVEEESGVTVLGGLLLYIFDICEGINCF